MMLHELFSEYWGPVVMLGTTIFWISHTKTMMDKVLETLQENSSQISRLQRDISQTITKSECATCQLKCQQVFEKTLDNFQKYVEINLNEIKNSFQKTESRYDIDRRFLLEQLQKIFEKMSNFQERG